MNRELERHLDYLIEKDNQFAKMCDGDSDFSRQRKYCFEVNALAYQLCKSVMDYYLVKDAQPAPQWISVKERLPEIGKSILIHYPKWDGDEIQVAKLEGDGMMFDICGEFNIGIGAVTHWMPLPKLPQD